jgi:hypothetical protein
MENFIKTLTLLFLAHISWAQVGINADNSAPHSSAQLDVKSTTKAFYPPRMTTSQKNAIVSPQAGAVVFDNTLNQLSFYNGSSWVAAAGSGLALPYNQSASAFTGYDGGLFKVTNTLPTNSGEGVAINGTITGGDGWAIRAMATNTSPFLTAAIYATNAATNNNGYGIWGSHNGGGPGIEGSSFSGIGVKGTGGSHGIKGTGNYGVFGEGTGSYPFGVRGETSGDYGSGVSGLANSTTSKGVSGFSLYGTGIEAGSYNGVGLLVSSTYGRALITTGGNVGIGVSEPTTILDIKSRMRIRHSAETSGVYFDGTTNTYKGFVGLETDNLTGFFGFNGAYWGAKMDNTTGEWMASKGLSVGGGTKINNVIRITKPYNIPNITAGSSNGVIFFIPGVALGDQVIVTADADMGSLIIGTAYVSGVDNVYLRIINTAAGPVDYPSVNFIFTIIR